MDIFPPPAELLIEQYSNSVNIVRTEVKKLPNSFIYLYFFQASARIRRHTFSGQVQLLAKTQMQTKTQTIWLYLICIHVFSTAHDKFAVWNCPNWRIHKNLAYSSTDSLCIYFRL